MDDTPVLGWEEWHTKPPTLVARNPPAPTVLEAYDSAGQRICILCGAVNPKKCDLRECRSEPADSWVRSHCYHCGEHFDNPL